MKFEPFSKKVEAVLGGNNSYIIPNFQRDYSWDKKNYEDFINDILSVNQADYNVETKEFINVSGRENDYFFGTILIVGEENKPDFNKPYIVIDGQQRLTTMTLFFAAIKDIIEKFNPSYEHDFNDSLVKNVKIKGKSQEYARLQNKSLNPILPVNILNVNSHKEDGVEHDASNKSQQWLLEAYDIILKMLDKTELAKRLSKSRKKSDFENIDDDNYIEFLGNLGDQILNSTVISIYSASESQANILYRNFNYRGIPLSQSDLIKNELLSTLDDSTDSAVTSWKELEGNIFSVDESINTFLFHYMVSKYPTGTKNSLFKAFKKHIEESKGGYSKFLQDILTSSRYYKSIITPNENEKLFGKSNFFKRDSNPDLKRQLLFLNTMDTTQIRIIFLGLFYAVDNEIINSKQLRKIANIITNHQALHVLARTSANSLTPIYKKYSKIFRSVKKDKIDFEITNLIQDLNKIIPSKDTITKKANLFYNHKISTEKRPSIQKKNMYMIKHILSTIACDEQSKSTNSGNNGYSFIYDSSLEHIIDQKEDSIENVMSLGNLLLLEQSKHSNTQDKKGMYSLSEISSTKNFFTEYTTFNSYENIRKRNNDILGKYIDIVKKQR